MMKLRIIIFFHFFFTRDGDQFAKAIEKVKASKKPIWGLLLPETRDDLPGSKSVIRLVKTCYKDFAWLGFGEN